MSIMERSQEIPLIVNTKKSRVLASVKRRYGSVSIYSITVQGEPAQRRIKRNEREADSYESEGYRVERGLHPDGAYFAQWPNRGEGDKEHEIIAAKILAQNGFSTTLDREGTVIKINNVKGIVPSSDGKVEHFSHEISKIAGGDVIKKIEGALKHTVKTFDEGRTLRIPESVRRSYDVRADIALSIAPVGSPRVTQRQIREGILSYRRNSKGAPGPKYYIHINEEDGKIYFVRV